MELYDTREERIFLTAYLLWLVSSAVQLTLWNNQFEWVQNTCVQMQNISYLLLLIKFFIKKRYTAADVKGIALITFCCLMASYNHYHTYIAFTVLFLYSAGNVRLNQILRLTFIVQGILLIVTMTASFLGTIPNELWVEADDRHRMALGFDYCTYPSHILLFLTLIWIVLRESKEIWEYLLFLNLNTIMYYLTSTQADIYLAFFAILGSIVWCHEYSWNWVQKLRIFLSQSAYAVIAVTAIALHYFFNDQIVWMEKLNTLMSNRLRLGHQAILQHGFSLFGKSIQWVGQGSVRTNSNVSYNYVDCCYLKETLSYGLFYLAAMAVLFYLSCRLLTRFGQHRLVWAILMTLFFGVANAQLTMPAFNPFILAAGIFFNTAFSSDKLQESADGRPVPASLGNTVFSSTDAGETQDSDILSQLNGLQQFVSTRLHRFQVQYELFFKAFSQYAIQSIKIPEKVKRCTRTLIFTALLFYQWFIRMQLPSYLASRQNQHMWVINTALFCLAILCFEKHPAAYRIDSPLAFIARLFMIFVMISDFLVAKQYPNMGFSLLLYGGLFCIAWANMEDPKKLLQEFKWAVKGSFLFVMVCSLLYRPIEYGICYTGIMPDATTFALYLLIVLVICLSDLKLLWTAPFDAACATVASYTLLLTGQYIPILTAVVLLGGFLVFFLFCWIFESASGKEQQLFSLLASISLSVLAFLGIQWLYHAQPLLPEEQQLYFTNSETEVIVRGFCSPEELDYLRGKLYDFRPGSGSDVLLTQNSQYNTNYTYALNLLGHDSLLEINTQPRWPSNSIITNLYRYGFPAGICYLLMLLIYLLYAVGSSINDTNYLYMGLAIVCTAIFMLIPVELPFTQLIWLIFYLNMAWLIVCGRVPVSPFSRAKAQEAAPAVLAPETTDIENIV